MSTTHKLQKQHFGLICGNCGKRNGQHRYGDDRCPNPSWAPGNGQSQWCGASSFREEHSTPPPTWPETPHANP